MAVRRAIYAYAIGKTDLFGKCFHRRVPVVTYIFPLHQTAGTVLHSGIRNACGHRWHRAYRDLRQEHHPYIFYCPWRAHPPAALPNHHVSRRNSPHLFFNVIVAVGADDLNLMTRNRAAAIGNFGRGVIQLWPLGAQFFAPLIIRCYSFCPQEMRLLLILR